MMRILITNVDGVSAPGLAAIARQGLRVYRDRWNARKDPRPKPYDGIGDDNLSEIAEDGTDFDARANGRVSVTRLALNLIAYPTMHLLKIWKLAKRSAVLSS